MSSQPSGGRVGAVLLDVGGVFLVPDPRLIGAVAGRFGGADTVDPETVIRAHYRAIALGDDGTALSWERYREVLFGDLGVPATALLAATAALIDVGRGGNIWRYPLPGGRAALARLAAAFPVGIVSNSDGSVEGALRDAGICQVGAGAGVALDVILDSHVVGVAKPDPGIFMVALERLAQPAEGGVYVGDIRCFDVVGARAAGLRPLHLDPYGFCPEPGDHEHVTSLGATADLLLES